MVVIAVIWVFGGDCCNLIFMPQKMGVIATYDVVGGLFAAILRNKV